jgi:two-component system OmpR family response regulator
MSNAFSSTETLALTAGQLLYLDRGPMVGRDRTLDQPESTADWLVLIIENETPIANEISRQLKSEGLTVRILQNRQDGLNAALNEDAALVVLAHPLAGADSLDIIEMMRLRGVITPILVISTLGAIDDRIRGLRSGADDYLVKPFAVGELAARVAAIMRRVRQRRAVRVRAGALEIDLDNQLVWRNGRRIELFPREFKILEYFLRRPGEVVTREDLLKEVWRYPSARVTNTVDVHLSSLRRKLDAGAEQPTIVNIRRAGFMLRKD